MDHERRVTPGGQLKSQVTACEAKGQTAIRRLPTEAEKEEAFKYESGMTTKVRYPKRGSTRRLVSSGSAMPFVRAVGVVVRSPDDCFQER